MVRKSTKPVSRRCSVKIVFLKSSQNAQENSPVRVKETKVNSKNTRTKSMTYFAKFYKYTIF